jgi:hypothetical protein
LDPRQLTGTFNQTATDVQGLINQLNGLVRNGAIDRTAIQDAQRVLNAVQNGQRLAGDPDALAKITQQVLDSLRKVEGELAQSLELLIEKDKIRTAQEDEYPASHSSQIKAYFETVGKQR